MKRRFALVLLLGPSCVPALGERDSLVTTTSILAVRAEPAEPKPGEAVHYDLLVGTAFDAADIADEAAWRKVGQDFSDEVTHDADGNGEDDQISPANGFGEVCGGL